MNKYVIKVVQRLAPRTVTNIRTLSALDQQFDEGPGRFVSYERELRALRQDIDGLRRDNRRVAELYDVVFERARADAAGVASSVLEANPAAHEDAAATGVAVTQEPQ